MRGADLLKRFDKNGDGKIDDDERADAKEAMLKEQIDRQMARVTAAQATPEQLRLRALDFFDEDRDGRLNETERATLQKFVESRVASGVAPARAAWREEFIKRVDKNANGRLDPDELAAIRTYLDEREVTPRPVAGPDFSAIERLMRTAIEASPEQRAAFDRNGDQRIDEEEWAAARLRIGRALIGETVDQSKLDAVASEVARRRELREKALAQPDLKK